VYNIEITLLLKAIEQRQQSSTFQTLYKQCQTFKTLKKKVISSREAWVLPIVEDYFDLNLHFSLESQNESKGVIEMNWRRMHKPATLELKRLMPPVRGASFPSILSIVATFSSSWLQHWILLIILPLQVRL